MRKYLLWSSLGAAAILAADHVHSLGQRVRDIESRTVGTSGHVARLMERLLGVQHDLGQTRSQTEQEERLLESRVNALESLLGAAGEELCDQERRLQSWAALWEGRDPGLIEARIEEVRAGLEQRRKDLESLSAEAAKLAEEDRQRLETIDRRLEPLVRSRDERAMWSDFVGPVVQLAGDSTVGSGVLLESRQVDDSGEYETYMLTAWHVVRDIYGGPDRTSLPVPVRVYLDGGDTAIEEARMVAYDVPLDVALLKLDTSRPVPHGALLASRDRLAKVKIFDRIYAVGCPLGNDPIPTSGEVAATQHRVDGCNYWMISAPTYIGNSGGGIFDADTHELLGIFSKIYTHGSSRTTIVPHMGLATPLGVIYDWLEDTGHDAVVEAIFPTAAEAVTASLKH